MFKIKTEKKLLLVRIKFKIVKFNIKFLIKRLISSVKSQVLLKLSRLFIKENHTISSINPHSTS